MSSPARESGGRGAPLEIVLLGTATAVLSVLPFSLMVAPVPLAALSYRHGLAVGIAAAVSSGAFAALITLSPAILAQVLLILAVGIALGEALRDLKGVGPIVAVTSAVTLVTTLLLMFLFERIAGMSPLDMAGRFWEEALTAMYGGEGGAGELPEEVRRALAEQLAAVRRSIPASLLLGSLGLVVLDFSLLRWLLERLGADPAAVPSLPAFGSWRFPPVVAGGYAAATLLEWVVGRTAGPALSTALVNVNLVLGTLVAVQGAAVAWHFLGRWGVARAVRVAAFAGAVLFAPGLILLFVFLGLADAVLHLRQRFTEQGGHGRESHPAVQREEPGE